MWVHYDREAIGDVIQAGRILELVSCSGPYGDWSGTMLTGGIGHPFSELPIKFDFSGASGVQTYTTETGGGVPVGPPWYHLECPVRADVHGRRAHDAGPHHGHRR